MTELNKEVKREPVFIRIMLRSGKIIEGYGPDCAMDKLLEDIYDNMMGKSHKGAVKLYRNPSLSNEISNQTLIRMDSIDALEVR